MYVKYFLIDERQLAALRRVAARLHSEDRLGGDAMRDLGHELATIAKVAGELPVPEQASHASPDDVACPTCVAAAGMPCCRLLRDGSADAGHYLTPPWWHGARVMYARAAAECQPRASGKTP